jgi:hypothetical protein
MREEDLQRSETGAARQSDGPSSQSLAVQLGLLMDQLRSIYPHQELAEETARGWILVWIEIVRRADLERFREALHRCFLECSFMPVPAEIAKRVPSRQRPRNTTLHEMAELKKRKAAGERFYGLADLKKEFLRLCSEKGKPMAVPTTKVARGVRK